MMSTDLMSGVMSLPSLPSDLVSATTGTLAGQLGRGGSEAEKSAACVVAVWLAPSSHRDAAAGPCP